MPGTQLVVHLAGVPTAQRIDRLHTSLALRTTGPRSWAAAVDERREVQLVQRADERWQIQLVFRTRAPEPTVDRYRARFLAVTAAAGLKVGHVEQRPSVERITRPNIGSVPYLRAVPDAPVGWFVDWRYSQRPLKAALLVQLEGTLDDHAVDSVTATLGLDRTGDVHDPADVEFGYRYLADPTGPILFRPDDGNTVVTLWRDQPDRWAVTLGYRRWPPDDAVVRTCHREIREIAQRVGLDVTRTWAGQTNTALPAGPRPTRAAPRIAPPQVPVPRLPSPTPRVTTPSSAR